MPQYVAFNKYSHILWYCKYVNENICHFLWHEVKMSNQADHTIVRLRVPPELKKQIEESAEQNNRSQSAEMVARLEKSFENNIPSTLVSEYMQAVEEKNDMIKKQLEISNLLVLKLAEKLPDDDPSKSRMLELINQLN